MKAITKITFLNDHNEKFFGEGPAKLLQGIEQYGSLRASANAMNMAYSKASKLIKQAEDSLGFPLTKRVIGGKDGGGSVLSEQGVQWFRTYEAYTKACIQANQALYEQYFNQCGCVIMASGLSKRFGSNKLLTDFNGKPMILHALEATEGIFHQRVVVTRHPEVKAYCDELGVRVILHAQPYRSDTVKLGLNAMKNVECCMFFAGDQPLMSKASISLLLETWKQHQDKIIRPIADGNPGNPIIFPKQYFNELSQLENKQGGNVIVKKYSEHVLHVPIANAYELQDVDTKEVLASLLQHIQNKEYSYD